MGRKEEELEDEGDGIVVQSEKKSEDEDGLEWIVKFMYICEVTLNEHIRLVWYIHTPRIQT